MSSGSISAMISSLKSNKSLRRNKEGYSRFYKKSTFKVSTVTPLSREENLKIIEENKKILKQDSRSKLIFGLFIILLYISIIIYGALIFLK